jgi:hypothetical protein
MHGQDLKSKLQEHSRLPWLRDRRRKSSYYAVDHTFLDPGEAESPTDICERSLTFAMDTEDASFGKTLLMLWLSYGLAKKEGRAFFIDDTRWPYGKYSSYFAPPIQNCSPPPAHLVLPCPHQARHLVVSAATARWTFGSALEKEFTQERRHGAERSKPIFDLIRTGYEELFRLVGEDASYARSRSSSMKEDAASHHGSVVGMQVRRGDLHPHEYQFSRDYLPLERYAKAARSLFRSLLPSGEDEAGDFTAVVEYTHSPLLLASDDPDIFTSTELAQTAAPFTLTKSQERIVLATKAALDKASPVKPIREPGSAYVKHVDENSGWEGGFYSRLFYSAGSPRGSKTVSEQAMRMRELVGRAYLMDLAILGESDGVVCGVSSAACRILGVMLGWDAVATGRWVNVDDGRPWSWDGRLMR